MHQSKTLILSSGDPTYLVITILSTIVFVGFIIYLITRKIDRTYIPMILIFSILPTFAIGSMIVTGLLPHTKTTMSVDDAGNRISAPYHIDHIENVKTNGFGVVDPSNNTQNRITADSVTIEGTTHHQCTFTFSNPVSPNLLTMADTTVDSNLDCKD